MAFRVESAGRTHTGLIRERNEDAWAIEPALQLWIVCDGMGGHLGGEVASQMAVTAIVESVRQQQDDTGTQGDKLVAAVEVANEVVHERGQTDINLYNMGTTVVAMQQEGNFVHICHVGDSRIYRWRQGELLQLTRDHSLVNLYADHPFLSAHLGRISSNVIVRAIGLRPDVEVDYQRFPIEHGDMYLLCCDGLTDMVDDWILSELLADGARSSVDECADALVRAALANGGMDNVTVIVLRMIEATELIESPL